MNKNIIQNTISFVKKELENAEGGHDWFHIERVYKNALLITKTENCNLLIVELASLLHDIADAKFNDGDETIGPKKAQEFLESQKLELTSIEHIVNIIANMSYSKSLGNNALKLFVV